jgi:hypothetical protein
MGHLGGVEATQVTSDTFQISARGNAYTGADTIQRYALRKAAETTISAGFDYFIIGDDRDRSASGATTRSFASVSGGTARGFGMTEAWLKPGQTLLVRMFKGSPPAERPINLYDARDVLKFAVGTYVPPGPTK